MNVIETKLPGVLIIEPKVFGDARGCFFETFNSERYIEAGLTLPFVQDNFSRSSKGVLRGLHLQRVQTQGKLIWITQGEIFDVAVDIRRGSPTFGQWLGFSLTADKPQQIYIPPGLAHGFCVLSETAEFYYKCTDYYHPASETGLRWDDPELAIPWPIANPTLSAKDSALPYLKDFNPEHLPLYEP